MEILRASNHRVMPWKNGGGSTVEIAAGPADASLDGFDWRVSMARVASDGPFSHFAGIDRTLAVIEGEGLELSIAGRAPQLLSRGGDPVGFPGDVAVSARLLAGPITDLNVMTRRGRRSHRLRRLRAGAVSLAPETDVALVLAVGGPASVQEAILETGDAALFRAPGGTEIRLAPGGGDCYLVEVAPARPA